VKLRHDDPAYRRAMAKGKAFGENIFKRHGAHWCLEMTAAYTMGIDTGWQSCLDRVSAEENERLRNTVLAKQTLSPLPDRVTIGKACEIIGGDRPIDPSTYYRGAKNGIYPQPEKVGPNTARVNTKKLLRAIAARDGGGADSL
jgi:hypothetical protein